MTLFVFLAAAWAIGVVFALSLCRAAAAADRRAERIAERLGSVALRVVRDSGGRSGPAVVVRWWDPAASYITKL